MESTTPSTALNEIPPVEKLHPIPYWHTAALVLVLGFLSVANLKSGHGAHSGHGHVRIYVATIIYEWLFTLYVWWGVRRSGGTLRQLIGGRWEDFGDVLLDFALAGGVWMAALMAIAIAAIAMGMGHGGSL